jgi:hypothetical protein
MLSILLPLILMFTVVHEPQEGHLVGHVDIGPLTPIERPGHKPVVPPEMYRRYTIEVTQRGPQTGQIKSHMVRMVATVKISDKGDYSIDLLPGDYQVGIKSAQPMMRQFQPQDVKIRSGKTTKLNLKIDTGIR